jgi:hypothetical protein
MEDRKQAIVMAAARRGTPGKSERRRREIPGLRQAGSLRKPTVSQERGGKKIFGLRRQNDDDQGESEVPSAKPASGAPSDSNHPLLQEPDAQGWGALRGSLLW